jgi:hypothetical protein
MSKKKKSIKKKRMEKAKQVEHELIAKELNHEQMKKIVAGIDIHKAVHSSDSCQNSISCMRGCHGNAHF